MLLQAAKSQILSVLLWGHRLIILRVREEGLAWLRIIR